MTIVTRAADPTDVRVERPTKALLGLEERVERGLESVEDAGRALREIRNGRHYRHRDYDTFEAYVEGFWQPRLSRSYAHSLIEAARVIGALREGAIAEDKVPRSLGVWSDFQSFPALAIKEDRSAS